MISQRRRTAPSWVPGPRSWTFATVLLSVLVIGAIAYIHVEEQRVLRRTVVLLDDMRQARVDLSLGFLHVTVAGAPFSRAQGLALLLQAVPVLEGTVGSLDGEARESVASFKRKLDDFRALLDAPPSDVARAGAELRIAFADLDREADRVDLAVRASLVGLSASHERIFVASLVVSSLLFLGICVLVHRATRAQERAQAALRLSEERWQLALEGAGDGVWDLQVPTGTVFYSRQWKAMLGYADADIGPGVDEWESRIHPDDRERVLALLQAHLDGQTPLYSGEYRLRCRDGSYRWVLDRGRVVERSPDRRPTRLTGLNRDVTDRREAEERLRQSEKMETLGHLAGGVAHDFNNQLTAILGYASLLEERLDDPGLQRMAARIRSASGRAAELTRQLLAFSRKGAFVVTPVRLHDIITEVVDLLERTIDKRIVIELSLCAARSTVLGDSGQLHGVLLNLAVNARDAMPQGGVLRIETSVVSDSPSRPESLPSRPVSCLRLIVSDTGVGMEPSVRDRIFEPFYTTKEKGTGLGLAAVYGTIARHGGRIDVESEPGRGTTFVALLPLVGEEEPAPSPPPSSRGVAGQVLVIDDEALVREVAVDLLLKLGYEAQGCSSGEEALRLLQGSSRSPELVLLDLTMPGLSGRETFWALRALFADLRVVLVSGHDANDEVQSLLEGGALGFLNKPYTPAGLGAKIREIVGAPVSRA